MIRLLLCLSFNVFLCRMYGVLEKAINFKQIFSKVVISIKKSNHLKTKKMKISKLFIFVLTVFFVAYMGQLYYGRISLEQSQERILCNYDNHLKYARTIYQDIRDCTLDYIAHTEANPDSLSMLSEKYRNVLYKDSLLLVSELAILEGQTQSMLSLHLDQIEHEYTNITIWAAFMGLLFLAFSFYSLFRIEDCIKKGRKGVQIMRGMQNKAQKIIGDIDSAKKAMDAKSTEIVTAFSDSLNKLQASFEAEINNRLIGLDEYMKRVQEFIVENEKHSNLLNEGGKDE